MANNIWSNYTEKTATPVDADEVMAYDSTDRKNKRLLFGTFWKWVAKKLNEATISELQTENKTIIGAINALNSETSKIVYVDGGAYDYNTYTPQTAAQDIIDTKLRSDPSLIQFVTFVSGSNHSMIVQKNSYEYASYILFGYSIPNIVYNSKTTTWH